MVSSNSPYDPSPYRPIPSSGISMHGFNGRRHRRSSLCKSFVDFSSTDEEDNNLDSYISISENLGLPNPNTSRLLLPPYQKSSSSRGSRPDFSLCDTCRLEALNSQVVSINEKTDTILPDYHVGPISQPPLSSEVTPLVSTTLSKPIQNHCKGSLVSSSPSMPSNEMPTFGSAYYRRMSFGSVPRERRRSLVGSYEESLFSGRMSAPSSKPIPFFVKIGALEHCAQSGKTPQCFRQVKIPFEAVFYKLGDAGEETPYVGEVDIRQYYKSKSKLDTKPRSSTLQKNCKKRMNFPGYKVGSKGQFQFIISNSEKTAFKVILVPYDLTNMPRKSKTFIRQKIFLVENHKSISATKGSLAQAVHIPVACPSTGKYYIYGQVRLVFSNRRSSTTSEESVTKACLTHSRRPSLPREGGETVSSVYNGSGVPFNEISGSIRGVNASISTTSTNSEDKIFYPEKIYLGVTRERECVRVETMIGGWALFSLRDERDDDYCNVNYPIGNETSLNYTEISAAKRCAGCANTIA
ncbi:hypothetical protein NADFUDRAFT_49017 [Nadsonia fulvescens var. elongata DSM 6958]|uniref:Atos-like conserved domain-containing protein n=1 Tax=Nadsonia fulvescens var. elongata DSM 6958 TaxID=857566 RepID=A0A1E3PTV8_9ASCO|nr:hypothetical protein NADFUDRAFT_49017 [Nadsonia fulvescens var. elongata DSM 6958]